jgi:uncharacterized protein
VQYFAWGINKPNVKDRRTELIRQHWDFIAKYDDKLIARGPVMQTDDLGAVIGSIHIVDLANFSETEIFVYDEPFAKAGLFENIIVNRFQLELGRTQFEYVSNPAFSRFFIYCPASKKHAIKTSELGEEHKKYCTKFDDHFVCHGSLLSEEGEWQGKVYFMEFSNQKDAEEFIAAEPYATSELYDDIEIFRWTMGGPENLNAAGALS